MAKKNLGVAPSSPLGRHLKNISSPVQQYVQKILSQKLSRTSLQNRLRSWSILGVCGVVAFGYSIHSINNLADSEVQGVFEQNVVCYTVADNGVEDGPDELVKIYADGREEKIGKTGTQRIETLTDGPEGYIYGIDGVDLVKIDRKNASTEVVNTVGTVRGALGDIKPSDIDSIARDKNGFWVVEKKRDRNTNPHTVTDYLIRLDKNGNVVRDQFGDGVDYIQVMNSEYGKQNQSVDDISYDGQGNLYGVGDLVIDGKKQDNLFEIDIKTGTTKSLGTFKTISNIEGFSIDPFGQFIGIVSAQDSQYYDSMFDITGGAENFPPIKQISKDAGYDFESLTCITEEPEVVSSSSQMSSTSLESSQDSSTQQQSSASSTESMENSENSSENYSSAQDSEYSSDSYQSSESSQLEENSSEESSSQSTSSGSDALSEESSESVSSSTPFVSSSSSKTSSSSGSSLGSSSRSVLVDNSSTSSKSSSSLSQNTSLQQSNTQSRFSESSLNQAVSSESNISQSSANDSSSSDNTNSIPNENSDDQINNNPQLETDKQTLSSNDEVVVDINKLKTETIATKETIKPQGRVLGDVSNSLVRSGGAGHYMLILGSSLLMIFAGINVLINGILMRKSVRENSNSESQK